MNKTVLVTGSSRGIGLAIAEAFSRESCNVVLNCKKDIQNMDRAVQHLQQWNDKVLGIQADVSCMPDVDRLFHEVERAFGPVDILVNNAAVSWQGLFQDMIPTDWEMLAAANLYSVFGCTHRAIPAMIRQKSGVILNLSSVWGERGASCEAVYAALKGGIDSFTRSLGQELGPSGIRVNAIAAGVIDTSMNSWFSEEDREALRQEIPVMRLGRPEDVAGLAVFLASDAAAYVNGQVIKVDGGWQ